VFFQANTQFRPLALRKSKNDGKVLKVILVQGFCPLKTEIERFPIGFRLNLVLPSVDSVKGKTYQKLFYHMVGCRKNLRAQVLRKRSFRCLVNNRSKFALLNRWVNNNLVWGV